MIDSSVMKIAVLLGTSRKGSVSEKVADFVCNELKSQNLNPICVSPSEHLKEPVTARSGTETPPTEWAGIMASARGLVIVSPEYNHGYPGELKLMLDQLYNEYAGKPVLVCGVSDGLLGGARMVENLLPVLVTLGLYPLRRGVYFARADTMVNKDGIFDGAQMKDDLNKSISKFREYLAMLNKDISKT